MKFSWTEFIGVCVWVMHPWCITQICTFGLIVDLIILILDHHNNKVSLLCTSQYQGVQARPLLCLLIISIGIVILPSAYTQIHPSVFIELKLAQVLCEFCTVCTRKACINSYPCYKTKCLIKRHDFQSCILCVLSKTRNRTGHVAPFWLNSTKPIKTGDFSIGIEQKGMTFSHDFYFV